MSLNLKDKIPGSKYFTWAEALYLPSWKIYHEPSEEEKNNIIKMAQTMDIIREFFNLPITIHCWIRPVVNNPNTVTYNGKDYNKYVKGSLNSAHKYGLAVDFHVKDVNCDAGRAKLIPKLEEFHVRMEDLPGSNWIHLDIREPGPSGRFFKP